MHPALERRLGKRLERCVLDLLAAAPTPAQLSALGIEGIAEAMRTRSPRLTKTLPAQILAALAEETVTVPGAAAFGRVVAGMATSLRETTHNAMRWSPTSKNDWSPTLLPRS